MHFVGDAVDDITQQAISVDGKDMVQSGGKGTPVYAPAKVLREIRLSTGLVFQNFNLFPHLTVLQNLCLAPVRVLGVSREQARETGRSLLKRMGLEGKEKASDCTWDNSDSLI